MGRTARLVLSVPGYAVLGVLTGVLALTVFVVSQNLPLFLDLVVGGSLPLENRLRILLELYPFVGGNFAPGAGLALVLVAALTGVNVTMVVYHFREHGVEVREGSGSLLAVVLGTLGAGCAACGSAVLVSLLSLVGVTGGVTVLPFDGAGFLVLAAVVILLSIHWLARGMRGGEINGCPVDL
jgi:hypothetical protein